LGDLHLRRLPLGPLRAHHSRHRGQALGIDQKRRSRRV
ncbi:MAG: Methionine aminopeptidase, partial [uncultured Rubrobacteraceae bacterium]